MTWYEYNMRSGTLSEVKTEATATLEGVIQRSLPPAKSDCMYSESKDEKSAKHDFRKRIRKMLIDSGAELSQRDLAKVTWEQVVSFMKKFYTK